MRPILVHIPSKLLFFVALAGAMAVFARDLILRRTNKALPFSSTPLYFVGGAVVLYAKLGDWSFGHPWAPVPIYSYGVMLGTALVVGWFLVMRFAAEDQHRSAGRRHDLHVERGLVDHRRAPPLVHQRPHRPHHAIERLDAGSLQDLARRPGRLRRDDRRISGQLVRLPQAQDPAAQVGGRLGPLRRPRDGHHAHRLLPVRV